MKKQPIPALILIASLAFAPHFVDFLSDAYFRKNALQAQKEALTAFSPPQTLLLRKDSAAAASYASAAPDQNANIAAQNMNKNSAAANADTGKDFICKIDKPLWHSSGIVILLHGSGGNETSLMPFARSIWSRAALIGIRGHIMQGKERRWYHKITATAFNQTEALQEADNLAYFINKLIAENAYDPAKITFVGYSNGANILTVMAMKYPKMVRRAVLLRPMPVLNPMPQGDLRHMRILALSGARDKLYSSFAEPLYAALRQNGAQVSGYRIPATHLLSEEDKRIISRWLKQGY